MKKLFALLAAAIALPLALGAGGAAAQEKVIRIPFATAFSGPFIQFGERLWRGGLYATEEINAAGGVRGGTKLEFYKIDTRSPETAPFIAEFRRACENKDVPMILANTASTQLFSVYEYAKECNMAIFAPTAGAHWVFPDYGKWIYRFLPTPATVLPVLYTKVKEEFKAKTVALSYTLDDQFSFQNLKVAREVLEKQGYQVVADLGTKQKETNFGPQVAEVRAKNPDIVIVSHQPDDGGKFVLQLRERGIKTQIVDAGFTISGADFWKLSNGEARGAVGFTTYASDDPRPIVQAWVKKWQEKTGAKDAAPDAFETATYDAVKVIAEVLNKAKSLERKDIADAFNTIKNYDTVTGAVSWGGAFGEAERNNPTLITIGDNGKLLRWPSK
jgi:branched-chain amino acid transport system substrate-binding protein